MDNSGEYDPRKPYGKGPVPRHGDHGKDKSKVVVHEAASPIAGSSKLPASSSETREGRIRRCMQL